MKVGDIISFPCEAARYERRIGLLIEVHDNPADSSMEYYKNNPRQVGKILYRGQIHTSWLSHCDATEAAIRIASACK